MLAGAHDKTRRRGHLADTMALAPQLIERLGWSADRWRHIVPKAACSDRVLRALVVHEHGVAGGALNERRVSFARGLRSGRLPKASHWSALSAWNAGENSLVAA
jgi:hypothetical protein